MANGRQRKRAVLLAKKEAELKAKQGLAGLNPEALASVVSDDTNDLDNVSYTTTGGATVSVKNDRNKDVTPTTNMLGGRKGYKPGTQTLSMDDELMMADNLGGRKGYKPGTGNFAEGPSARNGRKGYKPGNGNFAEGPSSRSARGFSFDDELLLSEGPNGRMARPQAKALTDFIGEDLSETPSTSRFVTVAMDSEDDKILGMDNSVIGEELNDDGTVTYELPADNQGEPEVTTTALTEAQLEPGMYDNVQPGQEVALTGTLDNKGYAFDANNNPVAEQAIMHNFSDEEKAAAGLSMDEQLKEQELMRQLEQETRDSNALLGDDSNTITGKGSLENQSVGVLENESLPKMTGDIPGYEGVKTEGRKGYKPGQDTASLTAEQEELLGFEGRKGYVPGESTEGGNTRGSRKGYKPGNDNDGVDRDALYEAPGFEGLEPEMEPEMDGYGTEQVKEEAPKAAGTSSVGEIAAKAKEAEGDIQAATAGDPEKAAIAEDAKTVVEEVKTKVESGEMTAEDAAKTVKGSLGQLGELLGIDGKDLVRGLMRYAGARIFGMSGNEAGRFMYEGFMADEAAEAKVLADSKANMGLGQNATAQQKNLKAYKDEIAAINNDKTLTQAEKNEAIKVADEMFDVNQGASMGRPVNIQGRRADGTEEVVAGRRNDNNSYDVFIDNKWVPIEESGLSEVQITGRNTNQAVESGARDMRDGGEGVPIPNAYSVDKDGTPLFNMKTEQAKRYGLIKRAVDNLPVVTAMMANPDVQEDITSLMGGLETWAAKNANAKITPAVIATIANDSVPKIYASATAAWLQALLRADTGAAYTGTEIADYVGTNIPAVGDAGAPTEFKLNQMTKATKALIPGAGEAAPYLMGIMDGSIMPDKDALEGVRIAKSAIDEQYGTSSATTTNNPEGLSDEELSAWNAY